MTPLILHTVDAFTAQPFAGNPAAVCVLEAPADDAWMQQVAAEMNLSETAFLHRIEEGWSLRWFTPRTEVALCGHATLASAFTLWETGALTPGQPARFHTLSGWLTCRRAGDWIEMDFPAKTTKPCPMPAGLADAIGAEFLWVGRNEMDYLVEVADEATLRHLRPHFPTLSALPMRGVIVTCRSDAKEFDFVSRFFAPSVGLNEDPVTGSAHCALGPYWQGKTGKSHFTAYQASERGGVVRLRVGDGTVVLSGQAVMMTRLELRHRTT